MIQPNELRIGNLVRLNRDFYTHKAGDIIEIDRITRFGFNAYEDMGDSDELRPEDIDPITISTQWLDLIAYHKDIATNELSGIEAQWFLPDSPTRDGTTILIRKLKEKDEFYYCELDIPDPEYIHQIQNVYFIALGSELTIKEKADV